MKKERKKNSADKILREITSILIWSYVLVDLFFFNLNIYLSSFFDSIEAVWFPWFRLLFAVIILIVMVLTLGTKRTVWIVFYVIFYPLRVIFYYLFIMIFRKPESLVVIVPTAIFWLKTFRTRVVSYIIACIGITLVLIKASVTISWIGISLCLIYIPIHYFLQIKKAISTSRYMSSFVESIRSSWQKSEATTVEKERSSLNEIEEGTEEYDKKKTDNIKSLLLLNSIHYFIAGKIKVATKNHVIELGLILSVCITFCITVLIYATCYYGLAWISPEHFNNNGSYWDFFNISFGALVHNSSPEFIPTSTVAQLLTPSEQICGVLLSFIVLFFLITVMRESFHESLNDIITKLESDHQNFESQLQQHYDISIPEAIDLIEANTKITDKMRVFIIRHTRVVNESDK